jgi:hypothetical protein
MINPVTITVRLKASPEKPRLVPSSLKCMCHQPASGVVAIDMPVPTVSTMIVTVASTGAFGSLTALSSAAAAAIGSTPVADGVGAIDVIEIPSVVKASDATDPQSSVAQDAGYGLPHPQRDGIRPLDRIRHWRFDGMRWGISQTQTVS